MSPVDTQSIWKSSTRLADGREIVYFDEAPGLGRAQVRDTRHLPPLPLIVALPTSVGATHKPRSFIDELSISLNCNRGRSPPH